MSAISPESCSKRSPVYRQLQGAEFEVIDGGAHALHSANDSSEQLAKGGLVDLSLVSRCGVRGPGAIDWLTQQGLPVPAAPNQAATDSQGQAVLRLSKTEHWLLRNPLQPEQQAPQIAGQGCYPVYCEDSRCWLVLTGDNRAQVMAKVCGVDLRKDVFELGQVVQTSIARVNAVIVHHQINQHEVFSIFSDSASAEYLWEAMLDAMAEFDGAMMGANSFS